jgi:hypothetical protein
MPPSMMASSSWIYNVNIKLITTNTELSPPPTITFSAVAAIAAPHFFCRQPLFHCSHHLFSPRMRHASCMSFGIIITRFAWSVHSLVLLKRPTRYASVASWRARRAMLCIRKSDFMSQAILRTRCWKGAFLIKRSMFFWYLRISQRATVPGCQ